jgi:hypothetical protein
MAEKEAEDIVGRLEALRKRVPEEKEKPPEKPTPERRRLARIVGILVVVLIIASVSFAGYKFVYTPMKERKEVEIAVARAEEEAFFQAKSEKLKEINTAFAGLPSKYAAQKPLLLEELNKASTRSEVLAIDVSGPADEGWRGYRLDELEDVLKVAERVKMQVGNDTYRGYDEIKQRIEQLPYTILKLVVIQEYKSVQFPMRLKREQAGGWAKPENIVDIWLKGDPPVLLANDAKVIDIMVSEASGSISLTETEMKSDVGSGTSTRGGVTISSSGSRTRTTQTSYSIDISELQKAAAANKLPEGYIDSVLGDYGMRLYSIKIETGVANPEEELLILFEVAEDEVPELVKRAAPSSEDRKDIFVTIVE